MKNIVSIDFDIIMNSQLKFYNHLVGQVNPTEDLIKQNNIIDFLQPDFNIFVALTKYIVDSFKILPLEKIHFITSHEQLLNYLTPNDKETRLFNIDYHHDLGYQPNYKNINCANWALEALQNNLISEYVWIHGQDSQNYDERLNKKYNINDSMSIESHPLNNLCLPDELIICTSFE